MGLSICAGMRPKKGSFFTRSESFQEILERIASAISTCLKEKQLDIISYITVGEESMIVGIHPAEQEIGFSVNSGYLVCSAKTSSAGPGYHAFIVELLEEVEKRCDLKWEWDNEEMGFVDECNYYLERDFNQLQNSMNNYLQALSKHIITLDSGECLRLCVSSVEF